MKNSILLLFLFVCIVLSLGLDTEFQSTWQLTHRASPLETMTIKLALKQQNLEYFRELYWKVATPGTEEYGQFKTIEEIQSILQPPVEVRDRLVNWLRRNLPQVECFGDFIVASGSVQDMENQFGLEIHSFANFNGDVISRAREVPVLPEDIRSDVELITGLFDLPPIFNRTPRRTLEEAQRTKEADDFYVIPQTLRNLYHITAQDVATNKKTTQCVVEFSPKSGVSFKDLHNFALETDIGFYNVTEIVGKFVFNPNNPVNGESTLDIQYIMAAGQGAQNAYWTVDGWIYDFAVLVQTRLAKSLSVPLVFSLSYGWIENGQCDIIDPKGVQCQELGGDYRTYITRSNTEMQKVGLTGRSILVASGDAGAASKMNINCRNKTHPVSPAYPASSDAVLSVGGTMLDPSTKLLSPVPPICSNHTCAGGGVEVACSVKRALITSGGGFSDVAAQPDHQGPAVQSWFNSGALQPNIRHFNAKGRAYPDVAGMAHNYLILLNGQWIPVDGTSASCPVFAGIISLLNDYRLNNNMPPLGPLGPLFYKMWTAQKDTFHDITVGNNTGTEAGSFSSGCFTEGYGTAVGWDPVTGLGVPNFPDMKAYIASMSEAHFGKKK